MSDLVGIKSLNSFAINTNVKRVIIAHTEYDLFNFWHEAIKNFRQVLILGGGSNVLFLENFSGAVLLNRIKGIMIKEDANFWNLHVNAGEVWCDLVDICLEKNIPGLERLALIPGYVGSAPIQNIGAYGIELKQVCKYVDVLQLKTGKKCRLSTIECKFGYRDSIFKHELRDHHAIVAIGIQLSKFWYPILNYKYLTYPNSKYVTPKQIYDTVCKMRKMKLPDITLYGNAGSFFKNPIIDAKLAESIISHYPAVPYYLQPGKKVKLAAGWLIERCGLKGYRLGDAAVYEKQALVLININNNASSYDIVALARYIRQQVANRFNVLLEPEVRFIGFNGEVNSIGVIA